VPNEPGLHIKFQAAAKGSQEKTLALPETKGPAADKRSEDAKHIDIRTHPETRKKFYALYHQWAAGKDDQSMDAYLQFLLDHAGRAMSGLGYRPNPFRP